VARGGRAVRCGIGGVARDRSRVGEVVLTALAAGPESTRREGELPPTGRLCGMAGGA